MKTHPLALEFKTMDTENADLVESMIDLEIITQDFSTCMMREVEGNGDIFQLGDINVFEVSTVLVMVIMVLGRTEILDNVLFVFHWT